jgi:hypothetical protein
MSLNAFFDDDLYSERICLETRRRIRLSIAACAYEFFHAQIMSDEEFDNLAKMIDLSIDTRRPDLDQWFRQNFDAYTGVWIHKHPELDRIKKITKTILR